MTEFRFSYLTVNNVVTLDEYTLHLKTGPFIKKELQLISLQHFYVFDNKEYRSLYLLCTDNKGKSKKIQVLSMASEPGFLNLVNELQQRFPNKGLNHLPEAEAFKVMKTANPKKWAPYAAFLIMLAIMGGVFYPGLRHYFDFGFSKVNAHELIEGTYSGSRNISISGILLDKTLIETTTSHGTSSVSEFIPMVDENWKAGDPIKVVLSFKGLSTAEEEKLSETEAHLGVIRNIGWEGLSGGQIDFFKDHFGMTIDKSAILVEITNETHNDAWSFYGLLLTIVILGLVFLIVAKRRKN